MTKGALPVKTIVYVVLILLSFITLPVCAQEKLDGGKPLICATIQGMSCSAGEECERGLPESIGAPQFLRIDFAKKEIAGPKRVTQIRFMEINDEQITLQGFELGMGWALALDRVTGKATITFANKDEGFIVFAACTTP
jgi:hypothetical protein